MSFFKKKFLTSFSALNATQFFTALNDNVYKLLLVFFLISLLGKEKSNTILSLAGAVFVIPFLIFASTAGLLADRYSKQRIIVITRIAEIFFVSLAILFFALKSPVGGYLVLFCMATLSTLFSPCKYGILPEIVGREKISHFNGLLTATTYLAIILGTFLASFLADITHKNFVLTACICVAIAIASFFTSLGIEKTEPQAREKKISPNLFKILYMTFKRAHKVRYLMPALIFGAYFLFMGAYLQLNIIPFAIQSLHQTEIAGGYLFLLTAIGIGIGSFFAGRFSGRNVELAFVPLAALAISLLSISLYLFEDYFFIIAPLLILIGIAAGFYIIPIDAYIQVASPAEDRGQNVASANFLSFFGVLFASFLLALFGNFFELSAAQGFLAVGLITLVVALVLTALMADQLLRFLIARLLAPFWSIRISGRRYLHFTPPALLVAPRLSFVDTLIVMATLPRLIRYVIPLNRQFRKRRFLFRAIRLIPIDMEHLSPVGEPAYRQIHKELSIGHSVCLMLPSDLPIKDMANWEKKLVEIQQKLATPMIAIHITRPLPTTKLSAYRELRLLSKGTISISYKPL